MKLFGFKIFIDLRFTAALIFKIIKKCAEFSLINIYLNYRHLIVNKYKKFVIFRYLDKNRFLRDYLSNRNFYFSKRLFIVNCAQNAVMFVPSSNRKSIPMKC